MLSLQRSPAELVKAMDARLGTGGDEHERLRRIGADLGAGAPLAAESCADTVDPLELLRGIEEACRGSIAVDDFVPFSVAMLLEPLLAALGYGSFRLRASPFCGCASHTDTALTH